MSKKSRKRNKKILAAIGIGLGAAALASRKKTNSENEAYLKTEGGDKSKTDFITKKKKETPTVKTSTTVMDSMPAKAPKNEKSKRIQKNTNKVYTIEGAKKGEPAKVGNKKSTFIGEDGYARKGENATPMTTGRYGTLKAASEMSQGAEPPQLRKPEDSFLKKVFPKSSFKSGGRATYKSGGRVKGCGKALRGFGKAMKGKR